MLKYCRPWLCQSEITFRFSRSHITYHCFRRQHRHHSTSSRTASHRTYTNILLLLTGTSLVGGVIISTLQSNLLAPLSTIHADDNSSRPITTSTVTEKPAEQEKQLESSEVMTEDVTGEDQTSLPISPDIIFSPDCWRSDGGAKDDSSSWKANPESGIARYDVANLGSGSQITCYSSSCFAEIPSNYWVLLGIHDGHNGALVSNYLSHNLANAIVGSLADLYSKHATFPDGHIDLGGGPENMDYWSGIGLGRPYPPIEAFNEAVRKAFVNVDNMLVNEAAEHGLNVANRRREEIAGKRQPQQNLMTYEDAVDWLARAHCGSSSIVAIYESGGRQLTMANSGNSRAVIGRRVMNADGEETYEVHVLTSDKEVPWGFPDDQPRRTKRRPAQVHAFGDGPWKWDADTRKQLSADYPFIKTAEPWASATAEPEITTFYTQPGDFLVLANQGFWASLTNEEAIGLVGIWLRTNWSSIFPQNMGDESVSIYDPSTSSMINSSTTPAPPRPSKNSTLDEQVYHTKDLPVRLSGQDDTYMYQMWKIPKRFVMDDWNAALFLVRNATGGADKDMRDALLAMNMPKSRQWRSDVSVQVVFFT